MSQPLDDMYREVILDHYRAPRGRKVIDRSDISSKGYNPACGDELTLAVKVENDIVEDVHIDCKGCAISTASASMLAETIKGMSLSEAQKLAGVVRKMLKGEDVTIPDDFGDLDSLRGVRQFPVRIKCALLAWLTLLDGMKNYENGNSQTSGIVSTENGEA